MKQIKTAAFLLTLVLPHLVMASSRLYAECTSESCIAGDGSSSGLCDVFAYDPSGAIYQNSDGTYDAVALDGEKITGLVKTVSTRVNEIVEFALVGSHTLKLGYYGVDGHLPLLQQRNENRVGNFILQQCKLVEESPF